MTFEVCCHGLCLKNYLLSLPPLFPPSPPLKAICKQWKGNACLLTSPKAGWEGVCLQALPIPAVFLPVIGSGVVESQLPPLAALYGAQSFWGLLWEEHSFGL